MALSDFLVAARRVANDVAAQYGLSADELYLLALTAAGLEGGLGETAGVGDNGHAFGRFQFNNLGGWGSTYEAQGLTPQEYGADGDQEERQERRPATHDGTSPREATLRTCIIANAGVLGKSLRRPLLNQRVSNHGRVDPRKAAALGIRVLEHDAHRLASAIAHEHRLADRQIDWNTSVDGIEDEYLRPFLALGRMDRGQDEVVLIEVRRARFFARRVKRIQRKVCQRALSRRIACCNLFEMHKIGAACGCILVHPFEMRLVPQPRALDIRRPRRPPAQRREQVDEGRPVLLRLCRGLEELKPEDRIERAFHRLDRSTCGRWPDARQDLQHAATRSRGFSAKRRSDRTSFTCAESRNFNPPNLTNGMLPRVSSISTWPE